MLFSHFSWCLCALPIFPTPISVERIAGTPTHSRRTQTHFRSRIFFTRVFCVRRHTDEPQRGRNSFLWLQSRSVLSSFGVVLMPCRVNFHVVWSAISVFCLQNLTCHPFTTSESLVRRLWVLGMSLGWRPNHTRAWEFGFARSSPLNPYKSSVIWAFPPFSLGLGTEQTRWFKQH